jgi:NAD-reducing hydrogenase small subunit
MMAKLRIATASLAGCFGCHMALLDMDERLLDLLELVEFDRTPLTDQKELQPCDIGLLEGGVANEDNLATLKLFRQQCKILIAIGACALNGGIPAMRNSFDLKDILAESYLNGMGLANSQIPQDAEIPALLNHVQPLHEIVKIDYFLPGCPPSGETIWLFLQQLLTGQPLHLPYHCLHYD